MEINLPKHLRRSELSTYLKQIYGISLTMQSLARMAVTGEGPQFSKLNRIPYYSVIDVENWVKERMTKPAKSTAAHKAQKAA